MNVADDPRAQAPILPELEQLLVRAARQRAASRFSRRRWLLAVAVGALVLAAAAAAATGVLHFASGKTAHGTYSVERATLPAGEGEGHSGSVCLQLRYSGRGPSYGCGDPPTAARPFGLVVADPLERGSLERVIYGLVASDIVRVSVVGKGGEHTDTSTEVEAGLPGRFFAVVVPHRGRIEVVGYDSAGKERARIGNLASLTHPPRSKAEAVEQGNPAGFAPIVPSPSRFIYKGKSVTEAQVGELELACVQGREVFTCYRSSEEAEAHRRGREEGR